MKNLTITLLFSLFTLTLSAQKKVEKVTLLTTAECNECKERIEEKLNYTKGIRFAELDVPSKMLTVQFQTDKITLDQIKQIISKLGYNADDAKADVDAYNALPACCKVNGHD